MLPADDGSTDTRPPPTPKWVGNGIGVGSVTGVTREVISLRLGNGAEVTYRFTPDLAGARVPPGSRDRDDRYLPADVKVNDKVLVDYVTDGKVVACEGISILRRPGGRVPPGYAPHCHPRSHDVMNAYQDHEEKGIPLPGWARPPKPGEVPKSPLDP
jgi:hypothetical protein